MNRRWQEISMGFLGFVVAVMSTVAPASAYYDDTHYYYTYYLARVVGYTPLQAYRLASANVRIDYSPETEPEQRENVFNPMAPEDSAERPRVLFHAFLDQRSFDLENEEQRRQAERAIPERREFFWRQQSRTGNPGAFFHFLQDEFSHAGYGSWGGHWPSEIGWYDENLPLGATTDYLSFGPPGREIQMVGETLSYLKDFLQEQIPKQRVRQYDRSKALATLRALQAVNSAPDGSSATGPNEERAAEVIASVLEARGDSTPIPDTPIPFYFSAAGHPSPNPEWELAADLKVRVVEDFEPCCREATGTEVAVWLPQTWDDDEAYQLGESLTVGSGPVRFRDLPVGDLEIRVERDGEEIHREAHRLDEMIEEFVFVRVPPEDGDEDEESDGGGEATGSDNTEGSGDEDGDGASSSGAVAALEEAVGNLERTCREASRHAEAARNAEQKALATSNRLEKSLGDLAPPASANKALSACSRLAEIKNGVIQSSELAKSKAAEARQAASSATSALTTCGSRADLSAADGAEKTSRAAVVDSLSAHTRAEKEDDLFDQITGAAETALAETRQKSDRLDTLSTQKATLRNHLDNLERSRKAAKAGFAQCEETQNAVRQQWLAAGGADDPSLAGFRQRIEAVRTDPGALPGTGVARTATELVQQIDSAERGIQEAVTGLTRCVQAESPYGKVLEAKQAILSLDAVTSELDALAALRTQCENELDSSSEAGATARGSADDDEDFDVREEPDHPSAGNDDGRSRRVDLGGTDRATEDGQITPEPGYGEGGAIGPPTPGPPPTDPGRDGFEEPSTDPDDPGLEPVDPTDPDIVDQGTSAGDLPGDKRPGSGRTRGDSGREPDRGDGEGPSRDDTVPGGGGDGTAGGSEDPGGSPGTGPDTGGDPGGSPGGDSGDDDTTPPGGCCGPGDSGGGSGGECDFEDDFRAWEARARAELAAVEDEEDACPVWKGLITELENLHEDAVRSCHPEAVEAAMDAMRPFYEGMRRKACGEDVDLTPPPIPSGGGSDDSGDGTQSGGNGCEQASNEWIAFIGRLEAEVRAHADDEDCQWLIDLDRETLRLVERWEKACRRPVENKEIIQQQIDELMAICADGWD